MLSDYVKIACNNIKRRRLRSWLTLVGIIIGVTTVVALIGLGQGLQIAITGLFGNLGTDKLTISAEGGFGPPGTAVDKPLTKENLEKISDIAGVKRVTGRLLSPGKYEFNEKVRYGYIVSMPIHDSESLRLVIETFNLETKEGRMLEQKDHDKVILGSSLGDLQDYFEKDIEPGAKFTVQDTNFEVAGILEKQGNPGFDSAVYMAEDKMRQVFNLSKDKLDIIAVQVADEDEILDVQEDIEELMRKERGVDIGEEDFSVQSPQDIMEEVNSTLGAVTLFVYIIAAISILVGGIGIMNTMFMSITERTREIGIMKSIGARNETVFSLFFIESGLMGGIGGLLGTIFGSALSILGASVLQNFLGDSFDISAQLSPVLLISCIAGAFIVGSTFGTIPAYKASRLHPVDALRKKK
ncbi:MAG: ABC transporter permease [Nanoarchaeota archaeon]